MPACSDELCFRVLAVMCHVGGQRLLSKIIFTVCQPSLMNCVSVSLWLCAALDQNYFYFLRMVAIISVMHRMLKILTQSAHVI